jgi:hypothetical protein
MAIKAKNIKDFRNSVKAGDGSMLLDSANRLLANADVQLNTQLIPGDGTVTIKSGTVFLTKGSAAAITLNPPVAGAQSAGGDDGKEITFFSETAFAHVVTCSQGFNRKGSSGTATATAAANNNFKCIARNGQYDVVSNVNFTLA